MSKTELQFVNDELNDELENEWHSINTRLIEREDMKKTCFCGISEHCGYQIETDMEQHDKVIYEQGYNKAIDDFVKLTNEVSGWTPNCIENNLSLTVFTLHQIAEELKSKTKL